MGMVTFVGDREGPGEELVVLLDVGAQPVAVLEAGLKAARQDAGLELPGAVLDVVDAAAPGELPHRLDAAG